MNSFELLEEWRRRIERLQLAHYASARRYEHFHLWLGIPTIILSTIVGTSVFASLSQDSQQANHLWMQIAIGLLSVVAATLAALQTFLRYPELAEKHRLAGARFISLKREIELLMLVPLTPDEMVRGAMADIKTRWMKLQEDNPNLPGNIWERAKLETPIQERELSGTYASAIDCR